MNYKLLFPTYRNRYRFVRDQLKKRNSGATSEKVLNLGTGEGDYDPMIAPYCGKLIACDINEQDVAFAQELNEAVPNLSYKVENALALSFSENSFDLLVSVDVMEHVGEPEQMTKEISRVLRPGGLAYITFPQYYFPWTYDPINKVLRKLTGRKIPQGAYAFGHEYLIKGADFKAWAKKYDLEVLEEQQLSGHFVALLEMYWTGIIQRLFKANAKNISEEGAQKAKLRPSLREPSLVAITDALIGLDRAVFGRSRFSVGKGFVVQKRKS